MSNQISSQWQAGDILLEQYKIVGILGQDALGEVYRANHLSWKTDLVIRSLKPEIIAVLGGLPSLQADIQNWLNLGLHPHIVSCYYLRNVEQVPLLFTEYVPGGSLRDWINERRLYTHGTSSLKRVLDIAIQMAWGLCYAHEQGVLHQSLKPETVQVTPTLVAKLSDFGLTRAKLASQQQPSQQSDAWGWATTVLEMFLGGRIDAGKTPQQALQAHFSAQSTDSQLPALPEPILNLLQRCFQTDGQPTSTLRQIAQELQFLYPTLTGSAYPRQEPTLTPAADNLNRQALCQWDLGQTDAAFSLWNQALALQPQHLEATYNQGLLHWRSGRMDDIALIQQLEACRANSSSHSVSRTIDYLISTVHLERGDYQAAIDLLQAVEPQEELEADIAAVLASARANQATARRFLRHLDQRVSPEPELANAKTAVALSADGRYALAGGADRRVGLWQVDTGRCLSIFKGHQAAVTAVAFSPDGYYVVSGSEDKTIKLWNVTATNLVHTFDGLRERQLSYQSAVDKFVERISIATKQALGRSNSNRAAGHQGAVLAVDLSTDRQYILSGSKDKTVKLWDVETGRCLRTFKGHRQAVFSVLFSPDRFHFLSASEDQTVKLWDLASGEVVRTLEGIHDLSAVAFSADGQQILTAGSVIRVWDVNSGEVLQTLASEPLVNQPLGQASRINSIAVDRGRFVLAGEGRQLKLWELATGRCLCTFEGHEREIESVGFSADGRYALSADQQTLKLWAVHCTSPTPLAPLQLSRSRSIETIPPAERNYEQALTQAQIAIQQSNFVAAAQHLRQARSQPGYSQRPDALQSWFSLYPHLPHQTLSNVWEQATLQRHIGPVYTVAFSPDGTYALSGSADQTLKLWEGPTGRCLLSLEGHHDAVYTVVFSPDGTYALSGSADRLLKLWNVQSGECIWTLEGHSAPVHAVAFSPNGRFALSGSADKTCKLWDTAAGTCLRTLDQHTDQIRTVAFSPDGRQVLSGSADKTLKLWDIATGELVKTFTGHAQAVQSVSFSTNGRYILSGSSDSTLKIWSVSNGECLQTLQGHTGEVNSVSFSADGRYALSGSSDSTLKIWSVSSGECLQTLQGHTGEVNSVSFSADSRYALSGSSDSTLKLWALDWELADKFPAPWDEGARPYLEIFLALHTAPANLPSQGDNPQAVIAALKLDSTWTEADFNRLIQTLQFAGYGWLQPEGVRQQLTRMTQAATAKPVLQQPESTVFATAFATEFTTAFGQSAATVTLIVTSGSLQGEEFVFRNATTCIIGRAKDCHLQLPNDEQHNTVSRYHCALDIAPPSIRIRDLGSLHGTFVNGQMIGRRAPTPNSQPAPAELPDYALADGDEIQLGKTVLRVAIAGTNGSEPQTAFNQPDRIDRTFFSNNRHTES